METAYHAQYLINTDTNANSKKIIVKMCMVSKYNQQIIYERKERLNVLKRYDNLRIK